MVTNKKEIILPRKDDDGNFYISYSQISSWNEIKSFNLNILGKLEYIRSYFLGETFADAGWAEFGSDVEDYICSKDKADKFTDNEKSLMDSITPLGVFQKEIKIQLFDNVYLKGFVDDASDDLLTIRDYKTASQSSKQKYYKSDYIQLPLYAKGIQEETGFYPTKAEVCIIERKGNCFGKTNGRSLLSVGENVWFHTVDINEKLINETIEKIKNIILEISEVYKLFLKLEKHTI